MGLIGFTIMEMCRRTRASHANRDPLWWLYWCAALATPSRMHQQKPVLRYRSHSRSHVSRATFSVVTKSHEISVANAVLESVTRMRGKATGRSPGDRKELARNIEEWRREYDLELQGERASLLMPLV